jgi:hypothetical protein
LPRPPRILKPSTGRSEAFKINNLAAGRTLLTNGPTSTPEGGALTLAVRAAFLAREALADSGLVGGVKTSLDSTRAGGATVAAAHSPRVRQGAPVSFPVAWEELGSVRPGNFTMHTAPGLIGGRDPWLSGLPEQELSRDLIEEGHTIPIARVQAMHEGKRRARARRADEAGDGYQGFPVRQQPAP